MLTELMAQSASIAVKDERVVRAVLCVVCLTSPLLAVDLCGEALLAGVVPFRVQARKVGDAQDSASGSYI